MNDSKGVKRISYEEIMKAYKWMDSLKDGGLRLTTKMLQEHLPKIIQRKTVTQNVARRLRIAYFNTRGVYYGNQQ